MALRGFNHSIHWSEFQIVEQPPTGAVEEAEIVVQARNLTWRTSLQSGSSCQVVSVDVAISVDRNRSWVLKGRKGIYLRHHQQGHYDIEALGVREIYNRILAFTADQCEDINAEAVRIQQEVQQQIEKAQQRYDSQTQHGSERTIQQHWEAQIQSAKSRVDGTLADLPA